MAKLTPRERSSMEELRRLVKTANQRLRELEKQGMQDYSRAYEEVRGLNTMEAVNGVTPIFSETSSGEVKFRTDLTRLFGESSQAYRSLSVTVRNFLRSESSTPSGIKYRRRVNRERAEAIEKSKSQKTLEERFGFELTPEQYSQLWEDALYKKLFERFDSDSVLNTIYPDLQDGKLSEGQIEDYLNSLGEDEEANLFDLYNWMGSDTEYQWQTTGWDREW